MKLRRVGWMAGLIEPSAKPLGALLCSETTDNDRYRARISRVFSSATKSSELHHRSVHAEDGRVSSRRWAANLTSKDRYSRGSPPLGLAQRSVCARRSERILLAFS